MHFSVSESTLPLVVSRLLHCLRLLAWNIFPDFFVDELHLLGSCKSQGDPDGYHSWSVFAVFLGLVRGFKSDVVETLSR